jgi:hypothetical protein
MRTSPSIAPHDGHEDIYIVLDDFGSLGRSWRETDEAGTGRATLIRNLLDGQYESPVRIVAFNTADGLGTLLLISLTSCAAGMPRTTTCLSPSSRSWRRRPTGTEA